MVTHGQQGESATEEEDVALLSLAVVRTAWMCSILWYCCWVKELLSFKIKILDGLHCKTALQGTCRTCSQAEKLNETDSHSFSVMRLFLDNGAV